MSQGEPSPTPASAAASAEAPWLGLRSFTEETRDYFFGRGAELQDLYERIVHKPLTVLFGQSGLGKTSLIQAALIPRLREKGYLPVLLRLDHAPAAPPLERQMIVRFLDALRAAGHGALADDLPPEAESLWLLFHDPQYGLTDADYPRLGKPPVRPVFLFDQFEEIFTLGDRAERRADALAFRDALACLVENRAPESVRRRLDNDDDLADRLAYQARPAKVLLTLREDFLHVLERWRRQIPSLMDNRFELRLLTGPQALQAVVEPGKRRGPDRPPIISEETGAAIVRFVAGTEPDVPLSGIDAVPPLLSLICSELNARRFGAYGQPLEDTIQVDQLRGRSEDILHDFYHHSFKDVPEPAQHLVEDRLLSADGFRESLALDTAYRVLEIAGVLPDDARAAIARLVDHRLLSTQERGSVRRIELTHDVLTSVARASRDQRREREAAAATAKAQQDHLFQLDADQRHIAVMNGILQAQAEAEDIARQATCARYEAEALMELIGSLQNQLATALPAGDAEAIALRLRAYQEMYGGQHESAETLRRWCESLERKAKFAISKGDLTGALQTLHGSQLLAARLVKRDPADLASRVTLAVHWELLGNVRRALNDQSGAITAYQATATLRQSLVADEPDNPLWQHHLSVSHEKIGNVLATQGLVVGAEEAYAAATTLREALLARDPGNASYRRGLWVSLVKLGQTACASGKAGDGVGFLRRAVELAEGLAQENPTSAEWQRELSSTHLHLGIALGACGDYAGALDHSRRSVSLGETLATRFPDDRRAQIGLITALGQVGSMLAIRSDPELNAEGGAMLQRGAALRTALEEKTGPISVC